MTASPSGTVIAPAIAANAAMIQVAGRRLRGLAMICCPFRPRAMTVACEMVGVPARRGGVLTGLGLAGSLPFLLPASVAAG